MFSNPLSSFFCRAVHVFPVDENYPGAVLESARRVLEAGNVQVWFPEAWRSPDGRLQRFLPGIGQLLLRSGVPAVPAYIGGTFEALPSRNCVKSRWPSARRRRSRPCAPPATGGPIRSGLPMGCASGSSLSAPHPTSFRRQRCPTRPPLRIAPRITACERAEEKFDLDQRTLGRAAGGGRCTTADISARGGACCQHHQHRREHRAKSHHGKLQRHVLCLGEIQLCLTRCWRKTDRAVGPLGWATVPLRRFFIARRPPTFCGSSPGTDGSN